MTRSGSAVKARANGAENDPGPSAISHTRKQLIRDMLYERQGGKCYWCQQKCRIPLRGVVSNFPNMASYDHILPKSKGGDVSVENGVMACHKCNQARGSRMVNPHTGRKFDKADILMGGPSLNSLLAREFVGGRIKVKNLIKLLMARDKEAFVQFGTAAGVSEVVLGVTGAAPGSPVVIEVQ